MIKINKTINIFTENIYPDWELDEFEVITKSRMFVEYFLEKLSDESCLKEIDFDILSFDILFCDGNKTHQINKEYRDKDYVADIITFAIFADDETKFVLDGEVNLGEIIIALDKIEQESLKNGVSKDYQLYFLIAHGILHLLGFDHQTEEDYNFVVDIQKKALEYADIGE